MLKFFWFYLLLLPIVAKAQRIDLDIFGGISNYQGDLQPSYFTLNGASLGAAIMLKYGINNHFYVRTGFSFGSMSGTDVENGRKDLRVRNLNFRSGIKEFNAGLEYRLINSENFPLSPYVFAGAGIFLFDPYTYYGINGDKVYLHPLSTEGEGLPGYPDRKVYSLTQICIPYGLGIKWQVNCNLNLGFEFRQTKTFTDYLDDVSGTYVDENALLAARGQLAVDLAWRRDELDGTPYPKEGKGRGNPKQNDWFYFAGFTIGLKINDCETNQFSLGGLFKHKPYWQRSGGNNWGGGGRKKVIRSVKCP